MEATLETVGILQIYRISGFDINRYDINISQKTILYDLHLLFKSSEEQTRRKYHLRFAIIVQHQSNTYLSNRDFVIIFLAELILKSICIATINRDPSLKLRRNRSYFNSLASDILSLSFGYTFCMTLYFRISNNIIKLCVTILILFIADSI